MTRALLALLCAPVMALAEPHHIETNTVQPNSDTLTLEAVDATSATLTYFNHGDQVSVPGVYPMEIEGFRISVEIGLGGDNREWVRVTPADGLIAIEAYREVTDGDAVTITILQPMF